MADLFNTFGGAFLAFFGVALAAALPCIGSGRGTGIAGEAGAGLLAEDPSQFSKILILQVIPGTQGLYGFVTAFIALIQIGVFGGTFSASAIDIAMGARIFAACLPIAFGGLFTAVYQARVAASTINLVAKQPNDWAKGMTLCIIVEFYAILSLLTSLLMLLNS